MYNHFQSILNTFEKQRILIIGESFLDEYLQGYSERICREAPVPLVDVVDKQCAPGGAANVAENVAMLGGNALFLSVIGNDTDGKFVMDMLENSGVNTSVSIVDSSRETITKKRIIANHQILLRYDCGTTQPIAHETETVFIDHLIHSWMHTDAVIISDYGYGIITDVIIKTIKQLQEKIPHILIVDAKYLDRFCELHPTVIKPNYFEVVALLGITKKEHGEKRITQIEEFREILLEKTHATVAAVTFDAEGSLIFDQNGSTYRTYTDHVENPKGIGAGDTYAAAITLALSSGADIKDAAEIATLATKIIIKKHGTAHCTRAELQTALSNTDKVISNRTILHEIVEHYKAQKKKIVFTNGCFDILHSGHVRYLNRAKSLGDILILGINTDESIRVVKGENRPINNLTDRIRVLTALSSIDYVVPMPETTAEQLVENMQPDVYVKGGDYINKVLPEAEIVQRYGGKVTFIPLVKGKSTKNIIQKIKHTREQSGTPLYKGN